MNKLILIGGGGHCKSCIDVIELENKFEIVGILDKKEKIGQKVLGYEIIGTDEDIEKFAKEGFSKEDLYFLITLGQIETADLRIKIFEKLKSLEAIYLKAKIATIISPLSHVSAHAEVQEGTIVLHHALINSDAKVGKNCIINSKALIEHDAIVENHCHISTGAIINGSATIGEKSFVGSNSTIIHGAKIPQNSFIKAGSITK